MKSKITDEEILGWIVSGILVIDIDNPETITFRGRVVKPYKIGKHRRSPDRTRYAFGIRDDGRRRTIVRAKLVYMAGALMLVPDGFEIHHVDGDRYADEYENLVMVTADDHKKLDGRWARDNAPFI